MYHVVSSVIYMSMSLKSVVPPVRVEEEEAENVSFLNLPTSPSPSATMGHIV